MLATSRFVLCVMVRSEKGRGVSWAKEPEYVHKFDEQVSVLQKCIPLVVVGQDSRKSWGSEVAMLMSIK